MPFITARSGWSPFLAPRCLKAMSLFQMLQMQHIRPRQFCLLLNLRKKSQFWNAVASKPVEPVARGAESYFASAQHLPDYTCEVLSSAAVTSMSTFHPDR
jgi:hypothetical protein